MIASTQDRGNVKQQRGLQGNACNIRRLKGTRLKQTRVQTPRISNCRRRRNKKNSKTWMGHMKGHRVTLDKKTLTLDKKTLKPRYTEVC